MAEYSAKAGRSAGEAVLAGKAGEDQRRREGAVSIQAVRRAPLRLRHWVHWHVWVFLVFVIRSVRTFAFFLRAWGSGGGWASPWGASRMGRRG